MKYCKVILLILAMAAIVARSAYADRRPTLYNGDENWYYNTGMEEATKEYLEGIVDQLAKAKVSIYSQTFYSAGRTYYDTKLGNRIDLDNAYVGFSPETGKFLASEPLVLQLFNYRLVVSMQKLFSEGNEPIKVFAERCHQNGMKFLACLRMNDRHSNNWFPSLVREHPDFVMKWKGGGIMGGMDFRYPEVRDFIFKYMEEMANNYDIDGLELDWMRWCKMFQWDVPEDKRKAILNDYHRRIRAMLDEVGKRKGKKMLLSIRIPATIEECDANGYDVATYCREGLVDIICPTDFMVNDFHLPVGDFKKLTKGTNIIVLPTVHAINGMKAGITTIENIRALAHSYYQQGADGISFFNWYTGPEYRLPQDWKGAKEAGDSETVARLKRDYLFTPMHEMTQETGRYIGWQASVTRSKPNERKVFPIVIMEDLEKIKAVLKLDMEGLTQKDEIIIDVNGVPLDLQKCKKTFVAPGNNADRRMDNPEWPSAAFWRYEFPDAETVLRNGSNEIGLTLKKPNPLLDCKIKLFEIYVNVKPSQ